MNDFEWNFLKLATNYLYSKITDQFSSKKFLVNENWNQTNLAFLSALIDGLKVHNDEISSPIRFKLFVTYLLNLNARFIQMGDEDTLNEIVKVLYNDFMIKTIPIDLLTKFKNIACKKICSMLNNKNVNKHQEAFSQLLENQLIDPFENSESNDYSNETMYTELSGLTRQYLLKKSSSLILEITRNFDFKNDQDEATLIDYFKLFKKKRACSPASAHLDESQAEQKKFKGSSAIESKLVESDEKQSPNVSSSKENKSPVNKHDRIKVSNIKISKLLTPNNKNDSSKDKSPTKEQSNEQQEDPYDHDAFNALTAIEQNEVTTTKEKTTKAKTPLKQKQLIKSDHLISDSILKPRSESSPNKNKSFNSSISDLDFGESSSKKDTKSKSSNKERDESIKNKQSTRAVRNISQLIENISVSSEEEKEDESSSDEDAKDKPVDKNKSKLAKLNDSMELLSSDSDEPDKRSSFRPKKSETKRKGKIKWTEKETVYLAVGVELYGKGQWSLILDKLSKHFNGRTCVNLKDKWRNIERYNQISQLKKQAAVVIKRMQEEKKH